MHLQVMIAHFGNRTKCLSTRPAVDLGNGEWWMIPRTRAWHGSTSDVGIELAGEIMAHRLPPPHGIYDHNHLAQGVRDLRHRNNRHHCIRDIHDSYVFP